MDTDWLAWHERAQFEVDEREIMPRRVEMVAGLDACSAEEGSVYRLETPPDCVSLVRSLEGLSRVLRRIGRRTTLRSVSLGSAVDFVVSMGERLGCETWYVVPGDPESGRGHGRVGVIEFPEFLSRGMLTQVCSINREAVVVHGGTRFVAVMDLVEKQSELFCDVYVAEWVDGGGWVSDPGGGSSEYPSSQARGLVVEYPLSEGLRVLGRHVGREFVVDVWMDGRRTFPVSVWAPSAEVAAEAVVERYGPECPFHVWDMVDSKPE